MTATYRQNGCWIQPGLIRRRIAAGKLKWLKRNAGEYAGERYRPTIDPGKQYIKENSRASEIAKVRKDFSHAPALIECPNTPSSVLIH